MKRPGTLFNSGLLAVMVFAAITAWILKPTQLLADALSPLKLTDAVPKVLGDWQELPISRGQIVDPSQQTLLNKIYSETLTRTYINKEGYIIMLSIAYGRDQRDSLSLHQPEVCYPAQGFTVLEKNFGDLESPGRRMPVTRLNTQLSQRHEPVTYWTMIGENVYRGSINKRLQEFEYGFKNLIADGMLIRISSIDENTARAFAMQESFAQSMVSGLSAGVVKRFAGAKSESL